MPVAGYWACHSPPTYRCVTLVPDPSVPHVPTPDSTAGKEVLAFFGLASYHAQVLEQELLLFASMLHLSRSTHVRTTSVEALFDQLDSKTFGALLAEARRLTTVPPELEADLREALRCRNRLAHRFFVDHAVDIMSDPGRREMIEELDGFVVLFQQVDQALTRLREPLSERLGISKQLAAAELERMSAEAAARA